MVDDDVAARERRRLLLPLHHRRQPALLEIGAALPVDRGIGGVELRQPVVEAARDDQHAARVHLHVRIAFGVHVAVGAVHRARPLERLDLRCGHERTGAGGDPVVAGLADELRQPADFQFRTGADHEVRAAHLRDQARARFDHVHVLQRGGGDVEVDLVAGQFGDQRAPLGFAGEDVQPGLRGRGGERREQQDGYGEQFHDSAPWTRTCARRARRGWSGTAA